MKELFQFYSVQGVACNAERKLKSEMKINSEHLFELATLDLFLVDQ